MRFFERSQVQQTRLNDETGVSMANLHSNRGTREKKGLMNHQGFPDGMARSRPKRWTALAALTLVGCHMSWALNPTLMDPNLAVGPVVSGLSQPICMAFLGPNDFLVTEKASGQVKRVVNGAVTATVVDLPVNSASERGLLGIALHPNFPANPGVYLFWTESTTGSDSTVVTTVPLLGNRVDRFVWDAGNQTLTLSQNLIRLRAFQSDTNNLGNPFQGNHNGGQLRFGLDGKLYIFVGDTGRRGWMQNLPNGPHINGAPDDVFGGPSTDNAHFTGVTIRLDDAGTTPADNPFFAAGAAMGGEAGANVQKIFSYGHRNGFGIAFDPYSGNLWASENGDDSFDEINKVVAGGNYGWVQLMGPLARLTQFRAIEVNMFTPPNATIGALQQIRFPVTRLAYTPALALSRMFNLPGSSYQDPQLSWRYGMPPSGLGFVAGNGLGTAYAGTMWSGEARPTAVTGGSTGTFEGGYLMCFRLTPDRGSLDLSADPRLADRVADNGTYPLPYGTPANAPGYKFDGKESETLLIGQNFGVVTDIQTGPDGALYVVSNTDGMVYRIAAVP